MLWLRVTALARLGSTELEEWGWGSMWKGDTQEKHGCSTLDLIAADYLHKVTTNVNPLTPCHERRGLSGPTPFYELRSS